MKGVLYIDGADAYTSYGISLSDVAYDDLVCFPKLKPIAFNDWHERNGIEPDLSAPVIEAKDVTIPFYVQDVQSGYKSFIDALTDGAYHSFNFAKIGLTKELRLKSCGEISSVQGLGSFQLTFSDDQPMKGYSYSSPSSSLESFGDYLLDGTDFANYGVRMLKGTMDSILRSPNVKENLKIDISVVPGITYDREFMSGENLIPNKNVTFQSMEVQLRCLMRSRDAQEFWNNRNALVYDLTKAGERTLSVTKIGKSIPCFYKDCSVSCFYPDNGKFWFEFNLSLEFFKGVI
jgi:hypothetical protein